MHSSSLCDFDWQQLRQLAGEDSEFESELLDIFLQDAQDSLQKLESAIASKSIQVVEEVAHSLRGASANVGASALAAVALQLEQAARGGDITSARSLLRQLNRHCQRIRTQFKSKHV
ncbi:MAG: Hpt domain-containing protein [Phormidesmis sp.]